MLVATKVLMSRQKFCRGKHTAGSSRQRYVSSQVIAAAEKKLRELYEARELCKVCLQLQIARELH